MTASLCLLLGSAACGGKDKASKEDLVGDISATLQRGPEPLDEETADCVAEIVVEDIGVEELQDVDVRASDPPDDLQPKIAAATMRGNEECASTGEG
jgi:hypothetical protein